MLLSSITCYYMICEHDVNRITVHVLNGHRTCGATSPTARPAGDLYSTREMSQAGDGDCPPLKNEFFGAPGHVQCPWGRVIHH